MMRPWASWEPRHLRHCYKFPGMQYVELGAVLRRFGYTVVALHGCMQTKIKPIFGYQQQLVPGMRPGGAPIPNFFVPLVQQGQQGQRPGGRRTGSVIGQQPQQPVPLMQQHVGGMSNLRFPSSFCIYSHTHSSSDGLFGQQMLPRGRVYRYPPGPGMPDVSIVTNELFDW